MSTSSRSRRIGEALDRRYACSHVGCTKAFTRGEHLRRHKLNHESAHKLACTHCNATFYREDLWRRHLRVSHYIEYKKAPSRRAGPIREIFHKMTSVGLGSSQPRATERSQVELGLHHLNRGPESSTVHTSSSLVTLQSESGLIASSNRFTQRALPCQNPDSLSCSDSCHVLGTGYNKDPLCASASSQHKPGPAEHFSNLSVNQSDLDWESGLDPRHVAFITDNDISWLFDDSSIAQFESIFSPIPPPKPSNPFRLERPRYAEISDPANHLHFSSPVAPEDSIAEPVTETAAPSCGFRICNALTDEDREKLLAAICPDLADVDFEHQMFSLNNLKRGVHLYARHISKEYALFNHRIFAPTSADEKAELKEYYGEEAPIQLTWAIITLGWALLDSRTEHEMQVAAAIQGALRKFVLTHTAFTLAPPLWILQLLLLVLVFARYHGPREDYSFAIFHSVLICAVRRLDLSMTTQYAAHPVNTTLTRQEWLKWIRAETMRRIVFQTFILDVQQTVLHGGDSSMSAFELNLELPCSEKVWFSDSIEKWRSALAEEPQGSQRFLPVLKQFWNCSAWTKLPFSYPRDSKVVMYGIISIASEMRHREDNSFSLTPKESLSSLSSRVQKSFEGWVGWWGSNLIDLSLEAFSSWRNCSCMFKLAHTLYEIGAMDLQMIAGKEIIDGKKMRPPDYAKSQRKIRRWVKQDCALIGVSHAAEIIENRLSASYSPEFHCHHCQWILYLAGLVCWAFGFTVTGSMRNDELVQKGQVVSLSLARQQCNDYLTKATKLQSSGLQAALNNVNKTTGLLVTLIGVLEHESGSGLVAEAVDVLKRLVGKLR